MHPVCVYQNIESIIKNMKTNEQYTSERVCTLHRLSTDIQFVATVLFSYSLSLSPMHSRSQIQTNRKKRYFKHSYFLFLIHLVLLHFDSFMSTKLDLKKIKNDESTHKKYLINKIKLLLSIEKFRFDY